MAGDENRLRYQRTATECSYDGAQYVGREGLGQARLDPDIPELFRQIRLGRDDKEGRMVELGANILNELAVVYDRHIEIGNDEIKMMCATEVRGLAYVGGGMQLILV